MTEQVEKGTEFDFIVSSIRKGDSGHRLRALLLERGPVVISDPTGEYANLENFVLREEE